MQGAEILLSEYMTGAKRRFIIPVYQRNYDWKKEHCRQLFDDLVSLRRKGRKRHFFGCIVSVCDADSLSDEHLIIDGQQRLTTVSLLLLAMHNLLTDGTLHSDNPQLAQIIREDYLINKRRPKETRIKLRPVKNDQEALERLFEHPSEYKEESNLTINYRYFCRWLQDMDISVDELFDALERLEIIQIRLKTPDDDPQLIFESLNSTGLALSEGDKIRNFILMGQDPAAQESFHEQYWSRIEQDTGYQVSAFVRDFLSIRQQITPALSKTYFAFKEYVLQRWGDMSRQNMEELLTELRTCARHYACLLRGGTGNKALDACIFRLNRLETTVCRPFLLEVFRLHFEDHALSMEEVLDIFRIVESYIFRRAICDVPTNALNKIFLTLNKDVLRFDGTAKDYGEKLKYALSVRRESARFPNDAEFGKVFVTRSVYQMAAKNKAYLFERLENDGTEEVKDVWSLLEEGVYSIEHIMPQTLSAAWTKELGPDAEAVHAEWLNRVANLTLTAYNSSYSNKSFADKRDMKHGFRESGLRMNQGIAQKETWGLPELEERSEELCGQALRLWPYVAADFRPVEKPLESCSLDEEYDLTNRSIARFRWKGEDVPVSSWTDMYVRVMRQLHDNDPSVAAKLLQSADKSDILAASLSLSMPKAQGWAELAPDLWLHTEMNTVRKMARLRRFFELHGADPSELSFFLKESAEGSVSAQDQPSRYAVRRRYWEFALNVIRSGQEGGLFSAVAGGSNNWISCTAGYAGFSFNCVANQDGSRVELYLGNSDKALNKSVFDALFARREAVEAALGRRLLWQRKDEGKGSSVGISLKDVNIYQESDWPRMAEFHAEWSRRFYEVFTPHLAAVMEEKKKP